MLDSGDDDSLKESELDSDVEVEVDQDAWKDINEAGDDEENDKKEEAEQSSLIKDSESF